jgi:hypothetical protein
MLEREHKIGVKSLHNLSRSELVTALVERLEVNVGLVAENAKLRRGEPNLAAERERAFAEIDAAIAKLVEDSDAPVALCYYAKDTGIVCCEDERIAGKFTLAGVSYCACILQSAAEKPSAENRDATTERNFALVDAANVEGGL